jgi:hypothetical protein
MTHPSPASPVQAFLAGFVNIPLYIIGCFVPTHLALPCPGRWRWRWWPGALPPARPITSNLW